MNLIGCNFYFVKKKLSRHQTNDDEEEEIEKRYGTKPFAFQISFASNRMTCKETRRGEWKIIVR